MASRINRDFYGDVDDNIRIPDTWKTTHYWIQSLPKYGSWDLSQNDDFDTSAAPWGMPECSWSALPWIFAFNDSGLLKLEKFETKKRNTPLYFMSADKSTGKNVQNNTDYAIPDINAARALMGKSRIIGKTTGYMSGNSYYIDSTNAIDSGYHLNANVNQYTNEPLKNTITTFLDYQKIKMFFRDANFLDTSFSSGSWNAHTVKATDLDTYSGSIPDENVGMISATILPRFQNDDSTSYSTSSDFAPFVGVKTPIPERLKKYYYDNNADEWIQTGRSCSVSLGSINGRYYAAPSSMTTLSAADMKSSNFPWSRISMFWGNWCEKKQVFDDVSYHWELMSGTVVGQKWIPINDGDILGSTNYQRFLVMKIDAHNYDTIYQAFKAAVMHEIAFLGFPFIIGDNLYSKPIGTNGVYLPIFDTKHMMTTGRYINSSENAALDQINYTWGDVFDTTVPEYDPEYEPPEPEPEEGDSGNLINAGNYVNKFGNPSYTIWAFYGTSLGNNGLDAAISAINNLYITDPDGNAKWELDFKGTNPSDYIVGLYAFPLAFKTSDNSYVFTLGPVKFDTINVKKYAGDGYFSFGSINFDDLVLYGDFRDFPPYTTAEIYVPFCGSTSIDLAFFIGHTISVTMYYDIYTGACSAAIYRDNITLYKVLNGQIGVQLPLTSIRAGDYQNNIHALENALKQNDMRLATSALTLGISAGAAVATGGASLAAGAGLVTGTAGLLNTINERENIEYKLSHTQPAPTQTGASETQNGYRVGGTYAKLFIKRARMLKSYDPAKYAHTVGHACVINSTIGEQVTDSKNSLIKCSNVDLSGVTATASEVSAIQNLLTGGIYV